MSKSYYPKWVHEILRTRAYCVKSKKVCLPTITQAKAVRRFMMAVHARDFRHYECPFCKAFHITSQEKRNATNSKGVSWSAGTGSECVAVCKQVIKGRCETRIKPFTVLGYNQT